MKLDVGHVSLSSRRRCCEIVTARDTHACISSYTLESEVVGRGAPERRARSRRNPTLTDHALLTKPPARALVLEDDDVLAGLEDELEIPPPHRLVGPPAVDAPAIPRGGSRRKPAPRRPALHRPSRRHRARLVQSSRGTRIALLSGMRDHGATSTTVQTASSPGRGSDLPQPFPQPLSQAAAAGRTSSS